MKQKALLVLIAISLAFSCFSQQPDYVIKLVSKKDPEKVRYIYEGKRVKVYTRSEDVYAGKILIVDDSSIQVNEVVVPVDNIPKIRGNSTGLVFAKIGGGLLGIFGLLTFAGGTTMIIEGFTEQSLASIILVPLGIAFSALGVIEVLGGTSLALVNGKKYDLENDWDMYIIPTQEAPVIK
ncbi:MAG: hypothetical protein CVU11_07710 [Bacteroidetes bacterium HGW-Bacteroidetes-6]|jgi:D-alanyl-lipoteichoic acid acyltransferase DltB (MBOAT superfamily)|nr:MAG: hypothetical protein CVU11_07710 [Bacteroidetes bacterium HGW-Bacteroidetes-6]